MFIRRGHNQRGLTLIELMVALAVLGFVLLGSVRVIFEAQHMSVHARNRLMAANAGRSVLETIKDTPLPLVGNINTAALIPADLPAGNIQIFTNPANLNGVQLATVTVRITWTDPKGLPGFLELTTMRSLY